jgi:hypothetical protein
VADLPELVDLKFVFTVNITNSAQFADKGLIKSGELLTIPLVVPSGGAVATADLTAAPGKLSFLIARIAKPEKLDDFKGGITFQINNSAWFDATHPIVLLGDVATELLNAGGGGTKLNYKSTLTDKDNKPYTAQMLIIAGKVPAGSVTAGGTASPAAPTGAAPPVTPPPAAPAPPAGSTPTSETTPPSSPAPDASQTAADKDRAGGQ